MAQLSDPQKRFIVRRLAHFVPLKQVRAEFESEFNQPLSEAQVSKYNPDTAQGAKDLGDEMRKYFEAEREHYLTDEKSIRIASRAARLRILDGLLDHKIAQNAPSLTLTILKQAALEMGGMFERPKQETGGTGADVLLNFFGDALKKAYPDPGPDPANG